MSDSDEDAREQVRLIKHRELRQAVLTGNERIVRVLLEALGNEKPIIVNMTPAGANTLLYLAVQYGYENILQRLIDAGADGRSHAVTKYSPLYAAVHHGQYNLARIILAKFPELIQQPTVEKWLPIHAACINGHIKLLELLIEYKYPEHLYTTFKDEDGEWEWSLPFDPNARDVTGQSSLYIASILGNKFLVNILLQWKVQAKRKHRVFPQNSLESIKTGSSTSPIGNVALTPTCKRISFGIQAIMSKLSGDNEMISNDPKDVVNLTECERCPININMLCGAACETALLAAVRGSFVDVATVLLTHGANPNIIARPVEDQNDPKCSEEIYGLCNAPLAEACKQKSLSMVDLLLKYGARDHNASAFVIAMNSGDQIIVSRLLSKRVHPDTDYKINKKGLPSPMQVNAFSPSASNIAYSNIYPNVATIIDWHNNHSNVQLNTIETKWLVEGVLQLNPKLNGHPRIETVSLSAITRVDLSHNQLSNLPIELLNLVSLRYLNVAQNKICQLPSSSFDQNECKSTLYNCPVLEELYLQDNQLIALPSELFQLPSLTILDLSNNKLQELPFAMWKAAKLRELNLSFNLLKDLPEPPMISTISQFSLDKVGGEPFVNFEGSCSSSDGINSGRNSSCSFRNRPQSLCVYPIVHRNLWSNNLEVTDNEMKWMELKHDEGVSQLNSLNIANNLFTSIPAALPCLAVNLTRLNMAYNNLRSMGHVTSYPATLKQLDLSHNEISCWPSLPRLNESDPHLRCYAVSAHNSNHSHINRTNESSSLSYVEVEKMSTTSFSSNKSNLNSSSSMSSFRSTVLKNVCRHRRHLRLEALRTLILADNILIRIQLSTDDAATLFNEIDADADWNVVGITKSKIIFPNLSMLDISNNCLKEIPPSLHELSSLSVLNISGNVRITDLPPQLGLLTRLWNLNTRGCMLQDPLKSMIESKKYKTMDIIGYLKSIYEDAQTYARMKLMIVGVQGIGKTTLLDILKHGGGTQKTRSNDNHWSKRMGHQVKGRSMKVSSGGNISTVGVDIGTWICEKRKKSPGSRGPVMFRTWDFGGQKEYYATHQYFLSKRSLYLVLWKITDGHQGLAEIIQWLGNIQARAPNSPVIIVGTHFDAVGESFSAQKAEELQQIIREKFIAIPDAEKIGLPRVIDSIEISCKTLHNIRLLSNIIYDTAFLLRSPGSKEPLLLQKIPASYIALEDVINVIACNLRALGLDPVLDAEKYRRMVTDELQTHNYKSFRDLAEMNQATMFLHDNGVILHYDDATLRDFYFLDPQWLCDMLAHVVTVREINPFAPTGIMKLDDLNFLFRETSISDTHTGTNSASNRNYIVSLLNKFEVALTWDSRTLLIPSLLPLSEPLTYNTGTTIRIFQKYKSRTPSTSTNINEVVAPKRYVYEAIGSNNSNDGIMDVGLRRVLLMTYFPSGFWSRLITRLLADDQIAESIKIAYEVINENSKMEQHFPEEFDVRLSLEQDCIWNIWQTGVALYYGSVLIFKIWEVPFQINGNTRPFRNPNNRFKLKLDGNWSDLNLGVSSILEVHLPISKIRVSMARSSTDKAEMLIEEKTLIYLQPVTVIMAKLLALVVDHIDLLLEDWYPSLGTRFVHTSEGRFLITRLVMCPKCFQKINRELESVDRGAVTSAHQRPFTDNYSFPNGSKLRRPKRVSYLHGEGNVMTDDGFLNVFSAYLNATASVQRERRSEDSLCLSDADSGVGPDSADSSRNTSVDGHPFAGNLLPADANSSIICYTWMVEECILSVYNQSKILCPLHLEISMQYLAPDVIFVDIPDRYTIQAESIIRGSLLGRGAFGFVFKANCKMKISRSFISVAMKMLQPVSPGPRAKESALMAYKMALGKWDRDPLQHACKAYCTARQEMAVLLTLKHPNIVSLIGICIRPLALVLELAPLGALDAILKQYRRSGARITPQSFQSLVLQAARAIEYLHRLRIIYRDLKSENVLVWTFPPPHSKENLRNGVHIKIADYGISRQTAPSGSKGFGGTEGFMAPEIIRHNGEEEYTEKVDCFSFGMFIYENISLRQPFEGHESIKECILEGSRPALTQRESQFPTYCLDLMVLCWDEQPKRRPTASQIVSILTAPECIHLVDVIVLPHSDIIISGIFNPLNNLNSEEEIAGYELWLPSYHSHIDILQISAYGQFMHLSSIKCTNIIPDFSEVNAKMLERSSNQGSPSHSSCGTPTTPPPRSLSAVRSSTTTPTLPTYNMLCCCVVDHYLWLGDYSGNLHAYDLQDYTHVFSYVFDPVIKSPVIGLMYLPELQRVAAGLYNGRVFFLDSVKVPTKCAFAEGSFVLREIGSGFILYCMTAVFIDGIYELWCGQMGGKLNVFPMGKNGISDHQTLCHSDEPDTVEDLKVTRICANETFVFTSLYPGFIVYQWNTVRKQIEYKLDCSKLLPCSESLKSISIDEHLSPIKCQISALCCYNQELYVGTTWGCLIIADIKTLRPITVFRPYENEIKAIIGVSRSHDTPLIATIGRRYRSLISRYMDETAEQHQEGVKNIYKQTTQQFSDLDNHIHCLLWKAKDWT